MHSDEKAVRWFRTKLAILLVLKKIFAFATVWGLLWGTAVIILRATVGMPPLSLLGGVVGLSIAVSVAVILALRKIPNRTAVRASLDKYSRSGGLVMAAEDAALGKWSEHIPRIQQPRFRWRGGNSLVRFSGAAAFVCISLLIPERFVEISKAHPLDITEEVSQLADGIDVLKEEEIIELTQAEAFEKKLDQLQTEATGEDPAKTWEALDHLTDVISQESTAAAEDALSETENLTEAETLADALLNEASEMDARLLTEAMTALSGLLQKAGEENALLAEQLSNLEADALELTPDQLKEISAVLRLSKREIMDRLEKLKAVNLIDLETLNACEKLGECNSDGLAAFLAENSGLMSVSDCVGGWCRAGIGRGPGHAPMTWTDGSPEEGAEFKEDTLPLSNIASLQDSEIFGISAAAPSIETSNPIQQSSALNGASAGGGSSVTQTVLPRHKASVKRYFDRP